jgi:hypothetical protein
MYKVFRIADHDVGPTHQPVQTADRLDSDYLKPTAAALDLNRDASRDHVIEKPIHVRPKFRSTYRHSLIISYVRSRITRTYVLFLTHEQRGAHARVSPQAARQRFGKSVPPFRPDRPAATAVEKSEAAFRALLAGKRHVDKEDADPIAW